MVLNIIEGFWKLVSKDRFPKLKLFTLKMHLTFGNTCVTEHIFSAMKQVKSKNRNWMADQCHSFSADCARELFNGSNRSASLL